MSTLEGPNEKMGFAVVTTVSSVVDGLTEDASVVLVDLPNREKRLSDPFPNVNVIGAWDVVGTTTVLDDRGLANTLVLVVRPWNEKGRPDEAGPSLVESSISTLLLALAVSLEDTAPSGNFGAGNTKAEEF